MRSSGSRFAPSLSIISYKRADHHNCTHTHMYIHIFIALRLRLSLPTAHVVVVELYLEQSSSQRESLQGLYNIRYNGLFGIDF